MKTKDILAYVFLALFALFMAWVTFVPNANISLRTGECDSAKNWQGDEITCAQAKLWGPFLKTEIVFVEASVRN